MSDTTPLIVVLRDSQSVEDGQIIQLGKGATIDNIRSLASEKLGLAIPVENIILEASDGQVLTEIEEVRSHPVIYINFKEQIKKIPSPPKLPMVGNLYLMMPDMAAGWGKLFPVYGPLVKVTLIGVDLIGTNDPRIAEVFTKESEYFTKKIGVLLSGAKQFAGNGLFTSDSDNDEWKLAHKLLMPAFSPRAIKAYQPEMGKIAQETMAVLDQYKPDEEVEILKWCTNLTFETIGRIGFGYSFDLMGRDKPSHPFIDAMSYCLGSTANRLVQPKFMKRLPTEANRHWKHSVNLMHSIVNEVLEERKKSPDAKNSEKDLLGFMLNARDENNLGLTDKNIQDQIVTFLIAGHDTTANTLAWTLYELARNPDIQAKVLQEIANAGITHDKLPTVEQISSLKYISRVIKETLRCYPPVRAINKYCKKDCVVPGGYFVKAGSQVLVSTFNLHKNEKYYPNPTKYDPDRWTPEEEQKRPTHAWLPFSIGPRACIGMAFALQEAKTVLSMWLSKYEFKYGGPTVPYDPHQATTKPLNMMMTIHPRTNFPEPCDTIVCERPTTDATKVAPSMPVLVDKHETSTLGTVELPKVTFLFGTQTGTAQDYANQLYVQAKRFGFKDMTLCAMDQWGVVQSGSYEKKKQDDKTKPELLIICTATYNGQPPDSAEAFNKFLDTNIQNGKEDLLDGIDYVVFGLGNKNWRTYQAFPNKVDNALNDLGANHFFEAGAGDADKDMDGDFNEWCAHFWTHTLSHYGVAASSDKSVVPTATLSAEESDLSAVKIKFIPPTDTAKWEQAKENKDGQCNAEVLVNCELQKEGSGRSTRHIEIDISQLESVSSNKDHLYEAGDHIEIMPENSPEEVERVALGFGLVLDAVFEIDPESAEGFSPRSLAASIKGPITVRNALTYYADLLSPPSRRMLSLFATQLHEVAPETAKQFDSLTMPDENNKDQYPDFIKKYRTLLDLSSAYPQVKMIDLCQFLAAVGVMQPRRYSIASSPLVYPKHAHISVGVVDDIVGGRHYPGLASSYLSRLRGGKFGIRAGLKSSRSTFSMPQDITKPLIMISAGTGLTPFRGFLQERAFQKKNGQKVGACLMFFGCRHPDQDYIYSEELEEYVKSGVLLQNHVAFSRLNPNAKYYVQHSISKHGADLWKLLVDAEGKSQGAVYICGSGTMSRDVCSTFKVLAKCFGMAINDQEADDYLQKLIENKDFLQDVWG